MLSDFSGMPPASDWWMALLALIAIGGLIGLAELGRKVLGLSLEFPRKFVHVSIGLLVAATLEHFSHPLPPVVLGLAFATLNVIALRTGILKGMHGVERVSYGSVLYPLSFVILIACYWDTERLIIVLSMLVLALGDGIAAIVGGSHSRPTWYRLGEERKSIEGSLAMFLVSFFVLAAGLMQTVEADTLLLLACSGLAAAVATAWEALGSRGWDNISVPLSVAVLLSWFILPGARVDVAQLMLAAALGIGVGVLSHRLAALTAGGAVASFLVAIVVFGLGGWKFAVPLLAFFVLSSMLSSFRRAQPGDQGPRDQGQVFANGGLAGALVLAGHGFPAFDVYPYYLGTLAAVTADTWGTEIGTVMARRTVALPSFRVVPPGTDGGVSVPGLAAGIVGALVIAMSGVAWTDGRLVGWIVAAGVAGSMVDSLLGTFVQGAYRCPVCDRTTGDQIHCNGQPGVLVRGSSVVTNNGVNWACAFAGAGTMAGIMALG